MSEVNNKLLGWWLVVGIRHRAIVRAYSEEEAIKKADEAGYVDRSWESPKASFLGDKMPDVVQV